MLLTGSPVTAEEALRTGLVDELVEDQDLMARAEAIALEIAANAPLAIAETLKLVDEGLELRLDSAMALEAESFGRLFGTQDKAEGTSAFLEKRKPLWKGC
jgi:enoyl-CoA hydratase